MKKQTVAVYIRGGLKYSRVFAGHLTSSQIQLALLKQRIGCQRVISNVHEWVKCA